ARSGKKSPAVAVSQALDLLPPDARALVEKLPTDNPILVIAFILWLLTSSLGIVKTGVDIAASFGKEQPVATTQVNTTNIYYGVPVDSHAEASLKPVKREVQRRLDQERRRQEKMHRAQQKRSN
ncbi:hypothetical protein, partial [Devosia sp.]|uniref:hypothetical protein n=1 Tax=Devosia sp. TaxID=1871048 RepID=UPI002FC90903